MARPSQLEERRQELTPIVAAAFAELGYRRTTTAELARRCGVRQNILYRLWPDKKAMFIAAIDHIYQLCTAIWKQLLEQNGSGKSSARAVLEYSSQHHGEYGLYRIVFAGLSETDDSDIRTALQQMYRRFQRYIVRQIMAHRGLDSKQAKREAEFAAWGFVGLGTLTDLGRELRLFSDRRRTEMFKGMGTLLLEGKNK